MTDMRSVLLLSILVIGARGCNISVTTVGTGELAQQPLCRGQLIFEDNFDRIDLKKWQYDYSLAGKGDFGFQWYDESSKNSYTDRGILHIKPTLLADEYGEKFLYNGTILIGPKCTALYENGCGHSGTRERYLEPIKSAKLMSKDRFTFKFGRVEVRAKPPAGDWLLPAIWLLPQNNVYSGWPASGEIDLMKMRGNRNMYNWSGLNIGTQQTASTMHWGPDAANNKFMLTQWEKNNDRGYDNDFHLYQMEWTPDHIVFSVDHKEIGRVTPPKGGFWELGNLDDTGLKNPWTNSKMAPFDQEFYLIINLAVGGTNYFPDDAIYSRGKPWENSSPVAMTDFWKKGKNQWWSTWHARTDSSHLKVDYVRVWAL